MKEKSNYNGHSSDVLVFTWVKLLNFFYLEIVICNYLAFDEMNITVSTKVDFKYMQLSTEVDIEGRY